MSIRRSPWMGRKMSSCWGCIPVFQFCFRGFGGSSFHLCRWGYAPITRIIYSHGVRGWANPAITEVRATHCIHPYVYLIANLLRSWLPEGSRNDMCMFFFPEEVNFCRVWEVDRSRYPRYFPSRLTSRQLRQLIENLEIARYCDHTDLPCLVWVDHIVEPFGQHTKANSAWQLHPCCPPALPRPILRVYQVHGHGNALRP